MTDIKIKISVKDAIVKITQFNWERLRNDLIENHGKLLYEDEMVGNMIESLIDLYFYDKEYTKLKEGETKE